MCCIRMASSPFVRGWAQSTVWPVPKQSWACYEKTARDGQNSNYITCKGLNCDLTIPYSSIYPFSITTYSQPIGWSGWIFAPNYKQTNNALQNSQHYNLGLVDCPKLLQRSLWDTEFLTVHPSCVDGQAFLTSSIAEHLNYVVQQSSQKYFLRNMPVIMRDFQFQGILGIGILYKDTRNTRNTIFDVLFLFCWTCP